MPRDCKKSPGLSSDRFDRKEEESENGNQELELREIMQVSVAERVVHIRSERGKATNHLRRQNGSEQLLKAE